MSDAWFPFLQLHFSLYFFCLFLFNKAVKLFTPFHKGQSFRSSAVLAGWPKVYQDRSCTWRWTPCRGLWRTARQFLTKVGDLGTELCSPPGLN